MCTLNGEFMDCVQDVIWDLWAESKAGTLGRDTHSDFALAIAN